MNKFNKRQKNQLMMKQQNIKMSKFPKDLFMEIQLV